VSGCEKPLNQQPAYLDSAMFYESDSPKEFPDENLPSETVALRPFGGEGGR
jgi:hypothetical protein